MFIKSINLEENKFYKFRNDDKSWLLLFYLNYYSFVLYVLLRIYFINI